MKKQIILITLLFLIPFFGICQNDKTLFEEAQKLLENRGSYSQVNQKISEAIKIDSTNLEYRWVRVRNNLKSSSSNIQFESAVADMLFMIQNGGGAANVYANLGLAYNELANSFFVGEKPKPSTSYLDIDEKEPLKKFYKEAISKYELSIKAYEKAIEIKPESKSTLIGKINSANGKILMIQREMSLL